jgi:hypothetical protein
VSTDSERIPVLYRRFAQTQARGRSQLYEQVSELVAADPALVEFLAELPKQKWQPNLFFAAVQYLFGIAETPDHFRSLVLEHRDQVAAVMLERTTQTNQPARCATLLPALARIPGPLALLEVGAAAGLCLLPDRYDYRYLDTGDTPPPRRRGSTTITSARRNDSPVPQFSCRADPATPRPTQPVDVAWRVGLDLHPLSVTVPDDRAWLDALIWPGEQQLRTDLHLAIDLAATDPPEVHAGDLRTDLTALAAQAPPEATLVVFHTAVLAYLHDPGDRDTFAGAVAELREQRPTVWLANETPARIPGLDPTKIEQHPPGDFLLCADARPLARTDPHGTRITWLP